MGKYLLLGIVSIISMLLSPLATVPYAEATFPGCVDYTMDFKEFSHGDLEVQIDNQTIVELVRVYLNQDSAVKIGAWKKEHYSKPLILKVVSEGKSARKALQDALAKAQKDIKRYSEEFKKAK